MFKINNLSFSYGKLMVIDQLAWHLESGMIHGLVGKNGAGKTTLFNLISGNFTTKKGEISVEDKPINYHDIGLMETHPVFYPMITGREYMQIFTIRNKAFDIEKWNTVFHLPLKDVVDNYSTGMQKKLSLMGMLALNKPILILDEPFNGLDFETVQVTRQIIQKLSENGKTVIVSSHIPETLTNLCDTLSMMDKGRMAFKLQKTEFGQFEDLSQALLQSISLPDMK